MWQFIGGIIKKFLLKKMKYIILDIGNFFFVKPKL